ARLQLRALVRDRRRAAGRQHAVGRRAGPRSKSRQSRRREENAEAREAPQSRPQVMSAISGDERGVIVECPSCGQKNRLAYARLPQKTQCGKCKTELPNVNSPIEVSTAAEFDGVVS